VWGVVCVCVVCVCVCSVCVYCGVCMSVCVCGVCICECVLCVCVCVRACMCIYTYIFRCYMVYPAHLIEPYSLVNCTYILLSGLKAVYCLCLLSRTILK